MLRLIVFLCVLPLSVGAGPFIVGNGGVGVLKGDSVYLLDFVESGIEDSPYFKTEDARTFQKYVEKRLSPAVFPTELIAKKIADIYEKNKIFAVYALLFTQQIQWNFVNFPLEKTEDVVPAVDVPKDSIVQLANRRFLQIMIYRPYWEKMSPTHQTGLVMHEILGALLNHPTIKDRIEKNALNRTVIGYLFSKTSGDSSAAGFNAATEGVPRIQWPMSDRPKDEFRENFWVSPLGHTDDANDIQFAPHILVDSTLIPILLGSSNNLQLEEVAKAFCSAPKDFSAVKVKVIHLKVETSTSGTLYPRQEFIELGSFNPDRERVCHRKNYEEISTFIRKTLALPNP